MMIIALLIKFIYILSIHLKQNINILFKKYENKGCKDVKDPKIYIECANNMQCVYKNIEDRVMY